VTDPPRRSLADDPGFLASLADLDRGITVEEAPEPLDSRRPPLELFPVETEPSRPALPPLAPPSPAMPAGSLTHETFFGLQEPPFALAADPRFFYQSNGHDRAAQELLTAIRARSGIAVLIGDAGIGKTMVCRMITEEVDRRTLTSVVEAPFASIEELLKTVLLDFGVVSRSEAPGGLADASRTALWNALRDFLQTIAPLQASALVIIDEAQRLTADLLDQVRLLGDAGGNERLLQVVLAGEPQLREMLARPALKNLSTRVTAQAALRALEPGEVGAYIAHRVAVAGGASRVTFTDDAALRISQLSDGVPRAINLICDRALAIADGAGSAAVDGGIVTNAARQLGIELPAEPMSGSRKVAAAVLLLILAALGAVAGYLIVR
jgi:general secretion pathway protein A